MDAKTILTLLDDVSALLLPLTFDTSCSNRNLNETDLVMSSLCFPPPFLRSFPGRIYPAAKAHRGSFHL